MFKAATIFAGLVGATHAGTGDEGKGYGKPVQEPAVELPPLPPTPTAGCVEVYSIVPGRCHTGWVGEYHEQPATLNDKPMWLAAEGEAVRLAQRRQSLTLGPPALRSISCLAGCRD
jgi:hypothetical protein